MTVTVERVRDLLHYDAESGVFRWRVGRGPTKAGDVAGSANNRGYLTVWVDGRPYLAHRLAWLHTYGRWPRLHIDHANRDKADNRITNLREATRCENMQNLRCAKSGNKSELLGVYRRSDGRAKQWSAEITAAGRKRRLGHFLTADDAHRAYIAAKALAHPGAVFTTADDLRAIYRGLLLLQRGTAPGAKAVLAVATRLFSSERRCP